MILVVVAMMTLLAGVRSVEEVLDLASREMLLRWYPCHDPSGEGYGAAWLAHRSTVLRRKITPMDNTNMETGGWIPQQVATALQSVDLFECSVEHMSWLEQKTRVYKHDFMRFFLLTTR